MQDQGNHSDVSGPPGETSLTTSESAAMKHFLEATSRWALHLDEAHPKKWSFTPAVEQLHSVDLALHSVLIELVTSGHEVAQAMESLSGHVRWEPREGMSDFITEYTGYENYPQPIAGTDIRPAVQYFETPARDGRRLFVCQTGAVVKSLGNFYRAQLTPFAIIVGGSGCHIDYLEPLIGGMPGPQLGWPQRFPPSMIVDTYDMGEALPWIGVTEGPVGNGLYFRLFAARFSQEDNQWTLLVPCETDSIHAWKYDAGSDALTLRSNPKETSRTLNVEKLLHDMRRE
jgi:hypothetical protein